MADVTNEIMTNDKTKILSATGGGVSQFYTPRRQKVEHLRVYFSPKQGGSGTPSSDNVRPIEGWTGIEVNHCGKNLLETNINSYHHPSNVKTEPNDLIFTDGELSGTIISGQRDVGVFVYDNLLPPGTYTLSFDYINGVGNYYWRPCIIGKPSLAWTAAYKTVPVASNDSGHITTTFTAEEDFCINLSLNCFGNASKTAVNKIYNLQLEIGSQPTEYVPYKNNLLIPKEYQEVEYLESTGTQYFWTDVDIQDGLTVDSVQTFASGNDSYLFGGLGDSNTNGKTCFNGGYGGHVQGAYPTNYYTFGTITFDNQTKYHIIATHANNRRICIIDGVEIANLGTVAFNTPTGKCLCFGWNKVGTPANFYKGKVYSLKVSKASELLANYIPCYRKSDKVAGMYDAVSGQFYTNSGSGEFILGPAVNRYDIDWSEDVGTVYGGYVDLVSGELVETNVKTTFGTGWNLANNNNKNGVFAKNIIARKATLVGTPPNIICSAYSTQNTMPITTVVNNPDFSICGRSSYSIIFVKDTRYETAEDFMENMSETEFTYELATPITHQLSPTTLSTLMWDNNFWSNADRIEIEYDYIGIFDAIESRKNIFTATPHTATAKNSIVSFGTDMAADLKECKVWFLPKQDLHGYSKPWVGGAGKNKVDYLDPANWRVATNTNTRATEASIGNISASNGVVTLTRTSVYAGLTIILGYLKSGTTYTISGTFTNIDGTAYIAKLDEEEITADYTCTRVATPTFVDGAIQFTPEEDGIYELLLWNSHTNPISATNFQLELGSTATAYEPYSNICPIEGWDGITVMKTGKNIANFTSDNMQSYSWSRIFPNPFRKTGRYTISCQNKIVASGRNGAFVLLADNINANSGYGLTGWTFGGELSSVSFNINETGLNHKYIIFRFNGNPSYASISNAKIQIEEGSEATGYEEPPTAIDIPFPQTIYGGYVDLVNGEVVEKWKSFIADGTESSYPQNSAQRFTVPTDTINRNLLYERTSADHLISDKLLNIGANGMGNPEYRVAILSNQYLQMKITSDINTPELFREWLVNNNVQTVCELATPNHYPIDPQTLTTLRGANTIWSNTNSDVEITYWKHDDDAYQHVPSSPITSNDNFIIVTDDGYAIGEEDDFIVY